MAIKVNETDKCPHCGVVNRFESVQNTAGRYISQHWIANLNGISYVLDLCRCANCSEVVIFLNETMIYPLGTKRSLCPKEVPKKIAEDYKEACLVESKSKKAAAALARRCLQHLLHDQGIKKNNLNQEIDEAITQLPSYLSKDIDAIRHIGNFAAHPMKYKNTSTIVGVENGETEWVLDVIEQLFDFYYVMPGRKAQQRKKLNRKLKKVGKPKLK